MKLAGKILLAVFALVLSTMVGGALFARLPLTLPAFPQAASQSQMFASMVLGSFVMIVGLVSLACGLGGRAIYRWLALFVLLYVATGVNAVIELTVFSTIGGQAYMLLFYCFSFLVTAAVLAGLFGSKQAAPFLPQLSATSWLTRVLIAWIAFPVIYFAFGMCVAPFVVSHYRAGVAGLLLPPIGVIFRTQLVRSLLFMGCSLPAIMLWTGSRRRLIFALGLAHTVMVGLFGLSQASTLPMVLRVAHSLEITADSFVYAAVLALLFFPRSQASAAPASNPHSTQILSVA